jgi:restriction system protein
MWMIRSGEGGAIVETFLQNGIVAIGWEVPDLSGISTRDRVREMVDLTFPDYTKPKAAGATGMIARLAFEIPEQDLVVTYDRARRVYHIGRVAGPYAYKPGEFPHTRPVKWLTEVPRDALSPKARYSLGASQTVFEIDGLAKDEFLVQMNGKSKSASPDAAVAAKPSVQQEDDELEEIRRDVYGRALELIKDRVQQLSWEHMQDLVAGILRALGLKTLVSPKGPDQGKDITASPDGLGLQSPRVRVEVKHRKVSMGASEVRSFIGGLHGIDAGLYVSTGGFTKDAIYEAERSKIPVTLITLDRLVDLVIQHYDAFDGDARALLPLVRVYWPAG